MVVAVLIWIVERKRRNRGAQHFHGEAMAWKLTDKLQNGRVEYARLSQLFADDVQFCLAGQVPLPKQEAGLFKIGMSGKLVNINAAVTQDTVFTVDPADTGSSGYDAFKAFRRRGGGGHVVPRLLQVGLAVRGHSLHQHTRRNSLLYRIFWRYSN